VANHVSSLLNLPQVRYFTSWEVATHRNDNPCAYACQRYYELVNWVAKAQSQGKRVLISFQDQICPDSSVCPPPTYDAYAWGIDYFLQDPAFSGVREFTAWNEPNHPVDTRGTMKKVPADLAATYWNILNAHCKARFSDCTVAAGDLSDTDEYLSYTIDYRGLLSPSPSVWAIHAYNAVDTGPSTQNTSPWMRLQNWVYNYTSGKPVWITEVGVQYCSVHLGPRDVNYQNTRAGYLNSLLSVLPSRVERTYYYFLAWPFGQDKRCEKGSNGNYPFDTALLGGGDTQRAALPVLFPSFRANLETASASDSNDPAVVRDTATGYQWVYYVGADRQMWSWSWNGTWTNGRLIGGDAGANVVPAVMRDVATGRQWAYYIGADRQIWSWYWSGSWGNYRLVGTPAAANSSATVSYDVVSGSQWVYYVANDGQIWHWSWNGSTWTNGPLGAGGQAAANTSPAVVRNLANGHQWVYYVGADGQIWQWWWNGSSWSNARLGTGGQVAANTSPAVVRDLASGAQWVYYTGSDGQIWSWSWNGSSWSNGRLGSGRQSAINTSPAVVRNPDIGYQWVYYVGSDRQLWSWSWNASSWSNAPLGAGGQAAANVSPAAVRDPTAITQWVYYTGSDRQTWTWSYTGSWTNGQLVGGQAAEFAYPPATPTGFTGSGQDRTTIMYWNAVADATGYRVYKQAADGSWFSRFDTTTTGVFEPGLTNCVTYRYRVAAYNAVGESAPSQTLELTPKAPGQQC